MLLKNCKYLDSDFRIRTADILIENERIEKIGKINGKGLDCSKKLVTPGFCNAHVHSSSLAFRGIGEDMSLYDMFRNNLFPAEKKMNNEMIYEWAEKAMKEMIANGITCIFNMDLTIEPIVKAMKETGMKGIAIAAIKDQAIGDKINVDCKKQIKETEKMLKKNDKNVKVAFGLANERECSSELVKEVVELAEKYKTQLFMHVAESSKEHEFCTKKYNKTPIEWLNSLNALKNIVVIHGIHLNENDSKLLAKNKATVVHCPRSNTALGNGIANIKMLFNAGINLCIGTDHPMANPSLNVKEEISYAWYLQRANNYFINHRTLFEFASANAHSINGIEGRIRENAVADLVIWPIRNMECNLRNLIHTNVMPEKIIINGKVV